MMSLQDIVIATNISNLSESEGKELQELLNNHGNELEVDGIIGDLTKSAFNEFKVKNKLSQPNMIGKTTIEWLSRKVTVINQAGLDLIKKYEGFRGSAYLDPVKIPTIGYGATYYQNGRKVKMGDVITKKEAEKLLLDTVSNFATEVSALVTVPLSGNQFSALVSFAFNVGIGAFKTSTLLQLLNKGKYGLAANEFLRWDRAGNRVLAGLTKRRKEESDLFLDSN